MQNGEGNRNSGWIREEICFPGTAPQGWSPFNSPCLTLSFQIPTLTIWMLRDGKDDHEQQEEKLGFKVLHPLGKYRLSFC